MVAIVFWLLVQVGTVLFWVHILLHRKPPVKPFRRFFRSYLSVGRLSMMHMTQPLGSIPSIEEAKGPYLMCSFQWAMAAPADFIWPL